VEALIERDGKIIYDGKKINAVNNFSGKTVEVNLQGQTMMPGFIESHAHPVSIGAFIFASDIVGSGKQYP
jgi:predicted amidohydrolase YtcJ